MNRILEPTHDNISALNVDAIEKIDRSNVKRLMRGIEMIDDSGPQVSRPFRARSYGSGDIGDPGRRSLKLVCPGLCCLAPLGLF